MIDTMRIDVHQHLWTEPLLHALEGRTRLPFVRRDLGLCMIHAAGETPSAVDLASERPEQRAALLSRAGAQALIDAHLDGVEALCQQRFGAWGPLALDGVCAEDVDAVLARGCVGISLPAGAFAPPSSIALLNPLLARLEQLEAPLFIHPGPGLGGRPGECSLAAPPGWP